MNNNINVNKKSKKPYLLLLLCIWTIPGVFVGLGMLLYSVFRKKDIRLTVSGALMIVFSISIYLFFYSFVGKSSISKRGFEQTSQIHLNMLVKSIEFYKLQYGQYPDSLGQLKKVDPTAMVYDILPFKGFKPSTHYYNYEKVGNKYLLFSSGTDGIPNTKDDLYPQIQITDSNKIGLIRSK